MKQVYPDLDALLAAVRPDGVTAFGIPVLEILDATIGSAQNSTIIA